MDWNLLNIDDIFMVKITGSVEENKHFGFFQCSGVKSTSALCLS